jgi:hypothetical protein
MNHFSRVIFVALLLSACAAPTPNTSPIPTASQSVIPIPTQTPVHTEVLRSPDGTIRANVICYQGAMQWDCWTHSLNGNVLFETPGPNGWSPDGLYAVVCVGANHDSPCSGFQVWDMVHGEVKGGFASYTHKWSPDEKHTIVYLDNSQFVGVQDKLIALDASTGIERSLDRCPDWLGTQVCQDFPGVIISGQIAGLPNGAQATLYTYALDKNMGYGIQWINENGSWKQLLRKSFGNFYRVTIDLQGYSTAPVSYTVYLSGTHAYVVDDGQVTTIKADSLDFTFKK